MCVTSGRVWVKSQPCPAPPPPAPPFSVLPGKPRPFPGPDCQGPSLPSTLLRTHLAGVPRGRAFWSGASPRDCWPQPSHRGGTGSLAAPTGTGQSCPSSPFTQQHWGHWPRVNPGPGIPKSSSNGDQTAASPPTLPPARPAEDQPRRPGPRAAHFTDEQMGAYGSGDRCAAHGPG